MRPAEFCSSVSSALYSFCVKFKSSSVSRPDSRSRIRIVTSSPKTVGMEFTRRSIAGRFLTVVNTSSLAGPQAIRNVHSGQGLHGTDGPTTELGGKLGDFSNVAQVPDRDPHDVFVTGEKQIARPDLGGVLDQLRDGLFSAIAFPLDGNDGGASGRRHARRLGTLLVASAADCDNSSVAARSRSCSCSAPLLIATSLELSAHSRQWVRDSQAS